MTAAKAKLPAGVDKLPEGVELIGSSVRIHFMYRGERCREKIPGANVSKALIRYAGNKRLLIVTDPARMANGRMILFNCWAGLSLSEIIALGVDDVDREAGGVWVRRARVITEFKVPKERARLRFVELIDPALAPAGRHPQGRRVCGANADHRYSAGQRDGKAGGSPSTVPELHQ